MQPRTKTMVGLLLVVAAGVGLRLLPADRIFAVAYVNFQGDAWYHLRRLDWLLANFPQTLANDPYAGGAHIPLPPLFDFVLAFFVALAGWPEPGSYAADVAAAVAPAVLGGLVALPTFFLGRRLFSTAAGWIAAALAVLLPGPFLIRSFVGVTDHHVAEVLFTSLTLASLVAAFQENEERRAFRRRLIRTALAGVALGAYFLTWSGSAFIVPAIATGILLETLVDLARGRECGYRFAILGLAGLIALTVFLLFQPRGLYRYELQYLSLLVLVSFAIAGAVVVACLRRWFSAPRAAGVAILIAVIALAIALKHPAFAGFQPGIDRVLGGGASTVGETRPLFAMAARPMDAVMAIYGWSSLALLALPMLVMGVVRGTKRGQGLALSWIVMTLVATIGQNRFGYYLMPNIALLFGLALGAVWDSGVTRRTSRFVAAGLLAGLFVLNFRATLAGLSVEEGVPTGWHQALSWLRRTSPEPLGQPQGYFARYSAGLRSKDTVLTWWDYGYWVMRIARRVPLSNPTQSFADVSGQLLTSQPEDDIGQTMADLRVRHVVVADEMLLHLTGSTELFGKYGTMLSWAGRDATRYIVSASERAPDGTDRTVWLFRPAYFKSLAVHLYVFSGRAVSAPEISVVSLEPNGPGGMRIRATKSFEDVGAAERYRTSLEPGSHLIASRDPLRTCADLPARPGFQLAYESDEAATKGGGPSAVRVFAYEEPVSPSPTPR